MKYSLKKASIFGLVVFLIGTMTIPAMATSIQDAKDKKAEMQRKKNAIEARINDLEKDKKDVKIYIQKLDNELNAISIKIDKLEGKIAKTNENLTNTKAELAKAEETEKNQYATMKKRIKYMYENGSSDYVEVLLSSDNMADLLNRTEYISKISEYDGNMLDRYQETKQTVAKKKANLEVSLQELEDLNAEVKMEQEAVTTLVANKSAELAAYDNSIDAAGDQADAYAKKIAQQEDLIEQLIEEEVRRAEEAARKAEEERKRQEAANGGNKDTSDNEGSTSGFAWPTASSTRITSYFGPRKSPTAGASTNHKGIDIGVPYGSNVLAAASGTVSISTYDNGAGYYIMISHADGISTVYMHNSQLLVSVGDTVKKGQVIAKAGSTGFSTGPHIHFGVRVNGEYVNPLNYVSP